MSNSSTEILKTFNGSSSNVCLNNESWGFAVTAITSTFIIIGNIFVIAVLIRFPSRRFRALNWLICQLAIADLLVGLVVMWIGTFGTLLMETVTLMNSLITYGLLASFTSTSTLGVLFIAIDRYFYVLKHTDYRKIVTRRRIGAAIGAAIVVPFVVFVVAPASGWNCISQCDCALYNDDVTQNYCFGDHCSQMMTPFTTENVLIGGTCLLLLLIASISVYFHIFLRVRSQSSELEDNKQNNKLKKTEMHMIKTMIVVLCGFIVTTGPLAICCIVSYTHNERNMHFIMRGLVVMSTLNSILNPFFYFWRIPSMSQKLRKMIRSFLTTCCCCLQLPLQEEVFATTTNRHRRLSSFQVGVHWITSSLAWKKRSNLNHSESVSGRQVENFRLNTTDNI